MTEELLANLDKLHTTDLGVLRIRKNLSIDAEDVVAYCREKILSADADIVRRGKNWYVSADGCIITVNAYSHTIITAHRSTANKNTVNKNALNQNAVKQA